MRDDARIDKGLEFLFNVSRAHLRARAIYGAYIFGANIYTESVEKRATSSIPVNCAKGRKSFAKSLTHPSIIAVRSSFLVSTLIGRDQAGAICGFN